MRATHACTKREKSLEQDRAVSSTPQPGRLQNIRRSRICYMNDVNIIFIDEILFYTNL